MKVIRGVYSKGKIDLAEPVDGVPEGPVQVYVIPLKDTPNQPLVYGKYNQKYPDRRMSTEEDFKIAEWRGERDFDCS